jgi:hypothetical protein
VCYMGVMGVWQAVTWFGQNGQGSAVRTPDALFVNQYDMAVVG